jgi:hypothetical protein
MIHIFLPLILAIRTWLCNGFQCKLSATTQCSSVWHARKQLWRHTTRFNSSSSSNRSKSYWYGVAVVSLSPYAITVECRCFKPTLSLHDSMVHTRTPDRESMPFRMTRFIMRCDAITKNGATRTIAALVLFNNRTRGGSQQSSRPPWSCFRAGSCRRRSRGRWFGATWQPRNHQCRAYRRSIGHRP